MDTKKIDNEYNLKIGRYNLLREEALFIIKEKLAETDIKISSIENRIKSKESFVNKAIANEFETPFEKITDILGIRIITLFLSDLEEVVNIIKKSFETISIDDKVNSTTADFGYMSIHILAKMKNEFKGPRYDNIKDIVFEIQVRTITMNSWANISHYLDYKSDFDIPQNLKRDFYALSGLFYVADQHFELFFNQSKENRKRIDILFEKGNNKYDEEINFDTLNSYLKLKIPDRDNSSSNNISDVIEELRVCGYNKIQQIEDAFERCWDAFILYEKENPPFDEDEPTTFSDVGVVRVIFEIFDENYRNYRKTSKKLDRYIKMVK